MRSLANRNWNLQAGTAEARSLMQAQNAGFWASLQTHLDAYQNAAPIRRCNA